MASSTEPPPKRNIQLVLAKTRIAPDLLQAMAAQSAPPPKKSRSRKGAALAIAAENQQPAAAAPGIDVIIEFNRSFPGGAEAARRLLIAAYAKAKNPEHPLDIIPLEHQSAFALLFAIPTPPDIARPNLHFEPNDELRIAASLWTANYVFGKLSPDTISRLPNCVTEGPNRSEPLIYKIWLDQNIERCIFESVRTVKCDAAKAAFAASGRGIVWAVADTGIDGEHPHFHTLDTLNLPDGLAHCDFTDAQPDASGRNAALIDTDGHGTHVAGIIAGMTRTKTIAPHDPRAVDKISIQTNVRETSTSVKATAFDSVDAICGMAPECKIISLKVLQSGKGGGYSNLLAAIGYVQKANEYGRNLRIHGLNISLGFLFDPENFAAGQSPLCVEVDHLVRSGVCVVVAAGNGGYGNVSVYSGGTERSANLGTISDPGNAALAITVGSTHRDMPHAYGVSYFSAKGPTADGRMKPDLVAPGERIVSCALISQVVAASGGPPKGPSAPGDAAGSYKEAMFRTDNGTSMAAPHASGAIAAFLSVRGEFKGRPEQVKDIFVRSATDLNRRAEFQGAGLLDVMRALQTV